MVARVKPAPTSAGTKAVGQEDSLDVNDRGSRVTRGLSGSTRRGRPARAAAILRAAGSSPSRPRPSTASAPTRRAPRRWRGIYAAKERPAFNPLIAHVASLDGRASARAASTTPRGAGGGLLARAADAGGAGGAGLHGVRPRPRRPRQPSRSASRPIRSRTLCSSASAARSPRRRRTARAGSARRRADARAGRSRRTHRRGARRRADAGRPRIDHRRLPRRRPRLLRPGGVPREAIEALIGAPLGERREPARPRRRACSPRTTRRARRCGSTSTRSRRERQRCCSETHEPAGATRRGGREPERTRRPRRPPPTCSALRTLDASGAATIAVAPIPRPDSARRSTTACGAPPPDVDRDPRGGSGELGTHRPTPSSRWPAARPGERQGTAADRIWPKAPVAGQHVGRGAGDREECRIFPAAVLGAVKSQPLPASDEQRPGEPAGSAASRRSGRRSPPRMTASYRGAPGEDDRPGERRRQADLPRNCEKPAW